MGDWLATAAELAAVGAFIVAVMAYVAQRKRQTGSPMQHAPTDSAPQTLTQPPLQPTPPSAAQGQVAPPRPAHLPPPMPQRGVVRSRYSKRTAIAFTSVITFIGIPGGLFGLVYTFGLVAGYYVLPILQPGFLYVKPDVSIWVIAILGIMSTVGFVGGSRAGQLLQRLVSAEFVYDPDYNVFGVYAPMRK